MSRLLVIDFKVDKIIKKLQRIKDVNGKPLTYDTVANIIEAQLVATIKGMADGDTIIWKYFGSFVATKRRVDRLNRELRKKGKNVTLEDTGVIRMSFRKNGQLNGETIIEFQHPKKDSLEDVISRED